MKRLFAASCVGLLVVVSLVVAAEVTRYNFDEIEVLYASAFNATPVQIGAGNWLAQLVGGEDNPVAVMYGVVVMKKDGAMIGEEEFLKVGGEVGSERFLVNSASYTYYTRTVTTVNEKGNEETTTVQTTIPKTIRSFFWSAKKIVGNDVIKDFTSPIHSVTLFREFDEDGQLVRITLFPTDNGREAGNDFWVIEQPPAGGIYTAPVSILKQVGDPAAHS